MKRTPIKRKKSLRAKKPLQPAGRLGPGKKSLEWEELRKELKKEFDRKKINRCEARLEGCWDKSGLTFAHPNKRRHCEDLREVALACINCHDIIEKWPEKDMEEFVRNIINNRRN